MLIVIFDPGALQRAEKVEEDRKDGLVAHLDFGRVSVFFFLFIGAFSHTSFVATFHSTPSLPKSAPMLMFTRCPAPNGSQRPY